MIETLLFLVFWIVCILAACVIARRRHVQRAAALGELSDDQLLRLWFPQGVASQAGAARVSGMNALLALEQQWFQALALVFGPQHGPLVPTHRMQAVLDAPFTEDNAELSVKLVRLIHDQQLGDLSGWSVGQFAQRMAERGIGPGEVFRATVGYGR